MPALEFTTHERSRNRRLDQASWVRLRRAAMAQAEFRCEAIQDGQRCDRAASYARRIDPDGPDEVANIAYLCGRHHAVWNAQSRER